MVSAARDTETHARESIGAPSKILLNEVPNPDQEERRPEDQLILLSGQLFLRTARDEEALSLLRYPLDWPYLLEKSVEEGMAGLLAFQLRRLAAEYALDLPLNPFAKALHQIFARNGALFAELAALRKVLHQHALQTILLKGGALIETVYQRQPGLRPLSDLDLLCKTSDLPFIQEFLHKRGFRSPAPSSSFLTNGPSAFDLHSDLTGTARIRRRGLAFHFDSEAIWREASPLAHQDPTLLVLSPPHQFLHLAVHALKHSFSRLVWFVDLGLVFHTVRWEDLREKAEASGTLRALSYALIGLQKLMAMEIPAGLCSSIPRLNRMERTFLDLVVERRQMEALGEVMVAFSIPDLTAKLAYLSEFSFPRRKVLAEVFPTTPPWLLYPRRLGKLLAVGLRECARALASLRDRYSPSSSRSLAAPI